MIDVFFAKCFHEYINRAGEPRKYVKLVGELIDKTLKK